MRSAAIIRVKKKKKPPPKPRTAQRVCELEPKKCLSPWLARARQTNQTPEIISSVLLYTSCKKRRAWNSLLCKLGFPVARRMSRTTTQAASLESSDWRLIASHLALKRQPQLEKSFISQDWEPHHMDPQNVPEVTMA